jgi:putative acetyltransferase
MPELLQPNRASVPLCAIPFKIYLLLKMLNLARTNSENKDFIALVKLLDADLAVKDGDDHSFYSQFNKIGRIKYVIVAYENETAVGCGAVKEFDAEAMEIKRMYVDPAYRGKGIATTILSALEKWAAELSYKKCVLETGKRQEDAVQLYLKNGYHIIDNYGQYKGIENSLCFSKPIA